MSKWVYTFGNGKAEGDASMRNLLGGKGANLAEMNVVGLPVPPGFTVTTEVCTYYYNNDHTYPADLKDQVKAAVAEVEKVMGKRFADANNPLLFSVRSGARVSMPGMMDTVLNLGLNDETVKALAKASGSERFAYDSYRRFLQMFSDVVLGADLDLYEEALENMKKSKGYKSDTDLTAEDLKELVKEYKEIGQKLGKVVPQDPWEQLWAGIGAVFGSWMVDRAITYRKLNNIPGDWGTAVNVQMMAFGNMGDDCGTGVAFTRSPATGENVYYGEYLINAQGEDVVAGIRTPQPMASKGDGTSLEEKWPHLYKELVDVRNNLEAHYKDMQDMEFTIEHGKLWMLQCRNGKRTAQAAVSHRGRGALSPVSFPDTRPVPYPPIPATAVPHPPAEPPQAVSHIRPPSRVRCVSVPFWLRWSLPGRRCAPRGYVPVPLRFPLPYGSAPVTSRHARPVLQVPMPPVASFLRAARYPLQVWQWPRPPGYRWKSG